MTSRIKVRQSGKNQGKLYLSRVVTDGPVQRAFARKFGEPIGSCVKSMTEKKSHTKAEKLEILKGCMSRAGVGVKGSDANKLGVFRSNSYNRRKDANLVGRGQAIPETGAAMPVSFE